MLNERKLTERELDKRIEAIKGLLSNKRSLVKKYGKDAEKVMYGIATKQAKKKIEDMNLDNLKELIKKSIQKEAGTTTVDTGFSGRADYGEEDRALGREDELEMTGLEEAERAADRYNVNVFGYQTQYYRVCPAGDYGDMSDIKEETIRLAKLNDLLFKMELRAVKDADYAKKIVTSGEVEYIADAIRDQVDMMNRLDGKSIPKDAVDYVDNHVNIIFDAQSGIKENMNEGHGLSQSDVDVLKRGFNAFFVSAPEYGEMDKFKKVIKFILKSNILQDKTKDLSKGKVNEQQLEEFEVDDAVMELRNIVDEIEQKADEARDIVRDIFPNELSRLDGYGAFNAMYSANRYDTTLGKFVDRLEEEGYEIEDGVAYVNEEVTKPEEKKLKKIEKELNKASKMHKSQADRIGKIVKEKLTLKEEDLVDIPAATMMKIANAVTGVKSAAQVMVQFFDELADKEKVDFMTNAKFKLAINNLRELSQEEEEKEVSEKLTKRSKVDDFVDDFKKSDAKQFKGKSQEKRRKMAVAAYLSKQND